MVEMRWSGRLNGREGIMKKNKTYDVFISYRRKGGLDFVRSDLGLVFPENLPKSIEKLRDLQASFIDRGPDFEDTIVKMLKDQMTDLNEMSTRQRRKVKRQAEKVFLRKAARFKSNDGVIDDSERVELERLASASGISRNRLEELIENVEAAAARRAKIVAWRKAHPRVVAVVGAGGLAVLVLMLLWIKTAIFPREPVRDVAPAAVLDQKTSSGGQGRILVEEIRSAAQELKGLPSPRRFEAESDFSSSLRGGKTAAAQVKYDKTVAWIATEYESSAAEGRRLSKLGMQSEELIKARPDLVIRFANIRSRAEAEMRQLIKANRHADALNYYNMAKRIFRMLDMRPLDRPSFSE